jgi:acyl transferase domain-containing protein
VENQNDISEIFRGRVKRGKDTLDVFAADEELQEAIEKWLQRKKYAKLLDLWVKGLVFDWNKLYHNPNLRRISLPTYPFAKERYWLPESHWIPQRNKAQAEIASPPLQNNILFYDQLIDEVLDNRIDTDSAAWKIKERLGILK